MGLSTGAIVGVVAAVVVALVVAIVLVLLYTQSRFPEPEAETAPADAEAANAGANQKKSSHEPVAPEAATDGLKPPLGITTPRPHASQDPFGGGTSSNTAPSSSDDFTPTTGDIQPPTPDVMHRQQMHRCIDVGRDVEVQSEESLDEVTEVPPLQQSRSTSFKSSPSAVPVHKPTSGRGMAAGRADEGSGGVVWLDNSIDVKNNTTVTYEKYTYDVVVFCNASPRLPIPYVRSQSPAVCD